MSDSVRRLFILVLGFVLTLTVLVFVTELLGAMPPVDIALIDKAYWQQPVGEGMFQNHLNYILFMLKNVWVLWIVPLAGVLLTLMALRGEHAAEMTAYLERIHVVEQALKEARDKADFFAENWDAINRKFDELFAMNGEGWLLVDSSRSIRRWSRMALTLAQKGNPSILSLEGHRIEDVVSAVNLNQAIQAVFNEGKVWCGEVQVPAFNEWLMVWVFPFGNEVALVLRDISSQHRDRGFLQNSEVLLRQIVEESPRPVAVLDGSWRYMYVSHQWFDVMGISPTTPLLGQDHRQIVPEFPPDVRVLEQQLESGQTVGREEDRRMLQGREVVLNWNIRLWRDAVGRPGGYIFTVSDTTETVRLRHQVSQAQDRENALAYSDALTGLPNRQLFNDRLNMALAQAYRQLGKVALFFLDLDGFKQVNDQLGHDYGDLLLKQVAERLKTCVRQTDTVARLGGDEFTIILSIRDRNDAEQVAQKILSVVAEPYDLNGKVADHVGASIGIALYPQDGAQAADLIKKSDAAMYASKQAGKRTYRFATTEITVQA